MLIIDVALTLTNRWRWVRRLFYELIWHLLYLLLTTRWRRQNVIIRYSYIYILWLAFCHISRESAAPHTVMTSSPYWKMLHAAPHRMLLTQTIVIRLACNQHFHTNFDENSLWQCHSTHIFPQHAPKILPSNNLKNPQVQQSSKLISKQWDAMLRCETKTKTVTAKHHNAPPSSRPIEHNRLHCQA